LSDSLNLINKIEAAVKQKQSDEVQDLCHALKGNCLSVGAKKLSKTTELLGKFSSALNSPQALTMLENMYSDFSKVSMSVENYLRKPDVFSQQSH
jgi:two-component system sensor histidine kinase RpfC